MIKVIDIASKTKAPTAEGRVTGVLVPSEEGTRVSVSVREIDPGKTYRATRSEKTQVVYVLEGKTRRSRTRARARPQNTGCRDARASIWNRARKPR